MIEQIDDVVSDILNRLGVYGACDEKCTKDNPCRSHAESALTERILAAVESDRLLNAQQSKGSAEQQAQRETVTPCMHEYRGGSCCIHCGCVLITRIVT